MTNSSQPVSTGDDRRFARVGVVADGVSVAKAREELSRWLQQTFDLDSLRINDVVLAVNEALANSAEFAYRDAPQPGTVDLEARHDADGATLRVSIVDRGSWRPTDPARRSRTRGRGIPLMEALADSAVIDPCDAGTAVHLTFGEVRAASCSGAEVASA